MALASTVALAADDTRDIPLLAPPAAVGGGDFPNYVMVRVGSDNRTADVLFDTGSIGLRVLKEFVGDDVEITGERVTYVDPRTGNKLKGRVGHAKVSFPGSGGVETEKRIAFHVVEEVTCDYRTPDCPGWKKGQDGVMGVGYFGSQVEKIFSPLDQLPDELSYGLIIDAISDDPHVRLGRITSARYNFVKMRPARNTPPLPRRPEWNTWSVKVCFQVGRDEKNCDETIFDTAAPDVRFWQSGGAKVKPDGTLQAGQKVSMEIDDVFGLEVFSGDKRWNNEFLIARPVRDQFGADAGGQIFRRFVVAFDNVGGRIGFCKPETGSLPAKVTTAKACR